MNAIFCHDYPLAVEPASTPRPLVPIDMLLSAVSVLVVAQSSSEIPEGFMNNPVYIYIYCCILRYTGLGSRQKRIVDVTSGRSQGSFSVRAYT